MMTNMIDTDAIEFQSLNEDALSTTMEEVQKNEKQRSFVCPTCPKTFYCRSTLRQHVQTHSGLKDNICDICGKGFMRQHTLKLHKLRHSNEKPFKCEQCNKSFVTVGCLQRHMRIHTAQMPYKCKYCDRSYAQSNDLIKHLRLHLGDEIYTCDLCPQSFRLHTELRKHFPEHKNDDAATRQRHLAARQKKEKLLNLRLFSCPSTTNEQEESAAEIKNAAIETVCQASVLDLEIKQEYTEETIEPYVAHEIIEENDDEALNGIHKQKCSIKTEIDIETQNDYNAITEFSMKTEIEITEDPVVCETMSIKVESDDTAQSDSLQYAYLNNNMQIKSETESHILNRTCPPLLYFNPESPSAEPNKLNNTNSVASLTMITDLESKNLNNVKALAKHKDELSQNLPSLTCEECGDAFESRPMLQNHRKLHDVLKQSSTTCDSSSLLPDTEAESQDSNSNTQTYLLTILEPDTEYEDLVNANDDSLLLKPDPEFIELNNSNDDSLSTKSEDEPHKTPHNLNEDSSLPSNTYGIQYSCTICGKYFGKSYSLKRHMTSVHSSINRPYVCTKCGYRFKLLIQLKAHDSAKHNLFTTATNDKDDNDFVEKHEHQKIIIENNHPKFKKKFLCTECGKYLSCKRSLRDHQLTLHKLKEHNKQSTCMNDLDNFVDDFSCNECSFVANNIIALTKHKAIHETLAGTTSELAVEALSFSCEECGNVFGTETMLKNHKSHLHTYLQQPKKVKKTNIKTKSTEKVMCPDCGKYFSSNSVLSEHRKRHKHGRPYVCSICPMAFTNSSNLNHHMICHSGVKKYICDICGKGFTQSYSLKIHKRRHSNEKQFKCDYCELSFVVQATLDSHRRTHTGEKPYKCKYCDYAFAQSYDLRKHMRIHLGDEVYTCDFCPQGFRLATELRKHLMEHKNEDAETREKNFAARQEKEAKLNLKLYPYPMQNGVINDKRRIEKIMK